MGIFYPFETRHTHQNCEFFLHLPPLFWVVILVSLFPDIHRNAISAGFIEPLLKPPRILS